VMRGNREQITLTLPPETLDRIERLARGAGMTRAGLINLFIHRGLEAGL
jgi:predicted DNA-binding protein